MKQYSTPSIEYVVVSTKEDILTGSFYSPDDESQTTHGTKFVF